MRLPLALVALGIGAIACGPSDGPPAGVPAAADVSGLPRALVGRLRPPSSATAFSIAGRPEGRPQELCPQGKPGPIDCL